MIRNESTAVRLLLGILAMAFFLPQLTGCNTMQGAGKDIEDAGEAIQDEAEEKK
jgi:predicted small secreted protein